MEFNVFLYSIPIVIWLYQIALSFQRVLVLQYGMPFNYDIIMLLQSSADVRNTSRPYRPRAIV